jgi:superfamily II DNA or RNA helicase
MTPDDVEQINNGYATRELVLMQRTEDTINSLASNDPEVYSQLAWLVAHGCLDIRFAFLKETASNGIYHEKFGVFDDSTDTIAFTGSLNETFAAITSNFEYIDVFASWSEPYRVREKLDRFDRLWRGDTEKLDILSFPDALRQRLIRDTPADYPSDRQSAPVESGRPDKRELRPHQVAALDAWRANGRRGLLEMATGTGKTFTSLSELAAMLSAKLVRNAVILVPYIAIADQWREDVKPLLGLNPIVCHSQSGDWRSRLQTQLALGLFSESVTVAIALYDTASGKDFSEQIARLRGTTLLIADEVHNITLDMADSVLLDKYDFRLGLSATPNRYLDEQGTERVQNYFDKIVFEYSLGKAINDGILTPYEYHPVICGPSDEAGLSSLRGVNAAKFNSFVGTFRETSAANEGFALVYCQPQQLEETKRWLGLTAGKQIHTFTAEEDLPQRRQILRDFGSGFYNILVAMRCLDEGVDVPPTRSAFLLGSSENPKQFVQRRGRILRKYPGKTSASIYDYVYLPLPQGKSREDALRKELTRFAEFALTATNSTSASQIIKDAAKLRGIALEEYIKQGV